MSRARDLPLAALATAMTALLLAALPARAAPVDAVRAAEAAQCLDGEIATWADGRDRAAAVVPVRLVYRHDGAPPAFDEALVRAALQRSAAAWAGCGIGAELLEGEAARQPPPSTVRVQWDEAATRGNFALADLDARTLSLSAGMFALLARRNPRHPAAQTLQMAISHEMGHFFGLMAHSRRCIDVMSYYDDGRGGHCFTRDGGSPRAVVEYRALLPTACDIERCRRVNRVAR